MSDPYDEIATKIRKETDAVGVVLLVIGGRYGHGSSIQIQTNDRAKTRQVLAWALRGLADVLEQDSKRD